MLSYIVMDMGRGRDNNRDMDMVSRDSNHMVRNSWAKSTDFRRSSTCLIRPGVVGEPLGRYHVLTGTWEMIHITPLCSCTIHSLAVTLLYSSRVKEGDA